MDEPGVQQHFWIVWLILGMVLTGAAGILGAYISLVAKVESIVDKAMKALRDHLDVEMKQLYRRVERLEDLMLERCRAEHEPRPTDAD